MINYCKQINEAFERKHQQILKESIQQTEEEQQVQEWLDQRLRELGWDEYADALADYTVILTHDKHDIGHIEPQRRILALYDNLDEDSAILVVKHELLHANYPEEDNSPSYYVYDNPDGTVSIRAFKTESLKAIKSAINRLNEASMSAEDKADSDTLRRIYNKRAVRRNAALSKKEQEVLNKYGLDVGNTGIGKSEPYLKKGNSYVFPDNSRAFKPEYNIANKARITGSRDYAQSLGFRRDMTHSKYPKWGKDTKHQYTHGDDRHSGYYGRGTFNSAERDRQAYDMRQDYRDMERVLDDKEKYERGIENAKSSIQRAKNAIKDYKNEVNLHKEKANDIINKHKK